MNTSAGVVGDSDWRPVITRSPRDGSVPCGRLANEVQPNYQCAHRSCLCATSASSHAVVVNPAVVDSHRSFVWLLMNSIACFQHGSILPYDCGKLHSGGGGSLSVLDVRLRQTRVECHLSPSVKSSHVSRIGT